MKPKAADTTKTKKTKNKKKNDKREGSPRGLPFLFRAFGTVRAKRSGRRPNFFSHVSATMQPARARAEVSFKTQ